MFPILLGKNSDLEKRVKTLEDSGGGSSGGGLLVVTADESGKLNKTWQEIYDSAFSVLKIVDGSIYPCCGVYNTDEDGIAVIYLDKNYEIVFVADSTDSYPIIKQGD